MSNIREIPKHEQVYSHLLGAYVDKGLVELLELFHFHNCTTHYSCEGVMPCYSHPKGIEAYIVFSGDSLHFIVQLTEKMNWRIVKMPRSQTARRWFQLETIQDNIIVIKFNKQDINEMVKTLNEIYDSGECCQLPANDIAGMNKGL